MPTFWYPAQQGQGCGRQRMVSMTPIPSIKGAIKLLPGPDPRGWQIAGRGDDAHAWDDAARNFRV